ncbi:hypothetical protein ABT401_30765 [Streptomyces halstedii]
MPPHPAPTPVRRAVTQLDHRIEAVTGHDIDTLWAYRERGVLDEPHAQLVDRHRTLAGAQIGVTFYLKLLNRLTSGEFPVDGALFVRINRTVDQLEETADARDAAAEKVFAALEPLRPPHHRRPTKDRSRPTTRRHCSPSPAVPSSTNTC